MADNRKYLDYAGLSEFWRLVKEYYASTVDKADTALQGAYVFNRGSESATPIDVDNNKKITIDLRDYAKLSDIAQGVNFKGVVSTYKDLPASGNTAGDIYYVKDRSKEYIWVPENQSPSVEAHWEELGNIAALDNYYTKQEVNAKVSTLQGNIDTIYKAGTPAQGDPGDPDYVPAVPESGVLVDKIAEEAAIRAEATELLTGLIGDERTARIAADAKEVVDRDNAISDAFNSTEHVIALHEIRKLFGVETPVDTAVALTDGIASAGLGDTLVVSSEILTSGATLQIPANSDLTIDLSDGGSIDAGAGSVRVFNVNENATVEIKGGSVTTNSSNYGIVAWAGASLVINGSTIENTGSGVAISTNGSNYQGDIIIDGATIVGTNYFPACGNLVIRNSHFSVPSVCADSCAIYCKSGSVTIENSTFEASTTSRGDWKHSNNGYIGISCAAIFENCNYGKHGNLTISIDSASQFIVHDAPTDATYKNFGILVLDYEGNTSVKCDIKQKYYHAAVAGHVSGTPIHFNTEAVTDPSADVVVVEEING